MSAADHVQSAPAAGTLVWVDDPAGIDAYALARVVGGEGADVRVQPLAAGAPAYSVRCASCWLANAQGEEAADVTALLHSNEPTLLHNVSERYAAGRIYSRVGRVLLSINPLRPLPGEYAESAMAAYRAEGSGGTTLPPHLFAIGEAAYRSVAAAGVSASIIVSGESGAGKTEASKQLLRYLCVNTTRADPISARTSAYSAYLVLRLALVTFAWDLRLICGRSKYIYVYV